MIPFMGIQMIIIIRITRDYYGGGFVCRVDISVIPGSAINQIQFLLLQLETQIIQGQCHLATAVLPIAAALMRQIGGGCCCRVRIECGRTLAIGRGFIPRLFAAPDSNSPEYIETAIEQFEEAFAELRGHQIVQYGINGGI